MFDRYMFGIFFSRYWAYSQQGLVELIEEYQNHQTPLDIVVTDMDWHETFYKEAAEGRK
jgi:alpha-glucosidase (family GH31 glycosyl hydrolase)